VISVILTLTYRPKSTVRIAFPSSKKAEETPVDNLCSVVKKSSSRLNLRVEGFSLFRQGETDTQMKYFEECEPISFTKGFLSNDTELGIDGKICLAVVLSYAFLDFCGKPWFPGGWTKDNLYLMQHRETMFLQPFLVTNLAPRHKESRSPPITAAIKEMKLLHHGILLMEIFQQHPMQLPFGGAIANLREAAQRWFKSIKWGESERFYKAVEACLYGETLISDAISVKASLMPLANRSVQRHSTAPEISDEEYAVLFCQRILAPLAADFSSQWQDNDPDQIISTLKLPSVSVEECASQILGPASTASQVCSSPV
jgi:hypothetical protein